MAEPPLATISTPPAFTLVALAIPPAATVSWPPLFTVPLVISTPLEMISATPLATTNPPVTVTRVPPNPFEAI